MDFRRELNRMRDENRLEYALGLVARQQVGQRLTCVTRIDMPTY